MKKLKDYYINEAIQQNISDFQKGLLIAIIQSSTPEQAYNICVGAQNAMTALRQLQQMGYVTVSGKTVLATPLGQSAAFQNNLIDNSGNISDEGKLQLNNFMSNKQEFINAN